MPEGEDKNLDGPVATKEKDWGSKAHAQWSRSPNKIYIADVTWSQGLVMERLNQVDGTVSNVCKQLIWFGTLETGR